MLASAYQPLHCDISNQVALELCQIRWKRSAHKERSIDFKAELLQTQMLLDNFTHYLLQQEFLFGSISECCSSTPYGSWQKHPSFPASGQHIPQLTLQLLSKVNPIAHSVTWGKYLTNLWTISICVRASACSCSPSEECYWVPPATWCHRRSPCSRTYTDYVVLSSGACSLTKPVLSHWPPPTWCLWLLYMGTSNTAQPCTLHLLTEFP